MHFLRLLVGALFLSSCQGGEGEIPHGLHRPMPITRFSDDRQFTPPLATPQPLPEYPWRRPAAPAALAKITKYHLRCRGDWGHPFMPAERQGEKLYLTDCGGSDSHSLPLRDGKEFIYPILIDLLNAIQEQSGSEVAITSGHRCPEHHAYLDPYGEDLYSKHQIGAAVDFYVLGFEHHPKEVVTWIQNYYNACQETAGKREFTSFQRYKKEDTDVSTPPWYNKEVFIKLYLPHEGRNGDNAHSYPYICLQVRWDREKGQKVNYSWKEAYENFHRF